jgi:hypothetical protein
MKAFMILSIIFSGIVNASASTYSKEFAYEIFLQEFSEDCIENTDLKEEIPSMCDGSLTINDLRQNARGYWFVTFHPTPWLYKYFTLNENGEIETTVLTEN